MASHLKVAAVIVTYEPDLRAFEANLKQASKQVIKTVVVDNGSAQQSAIKELCQSDAFDKADIQLIALADNEGLGAAHNAGINAITESSLDCSHVLILDQDTLIADDMVSQLSNSWQTLSRDKKIGALGGRYENTDKTSQSFFVRFGALKFKRAYCDSPNCEPIQADFLISSGTLFSIEALNDVGLMDEALFIDHVDTEWFLRAAHKEYEFYGVCQAKMTHSLGEKLHRIKLLRERHVPQRAPCAATQTISLLLYFP